jgi:uncharacterized protein YecT (DUF1311 family)
VIAGGDMRGFIFLLGAGTCVVAQSQHREERPEWKAFYARQKTFRIRGAAALAKEYAREKVGDCPDAKSTFAINECLSREIGTTQKNYEDYVRAIGGLLRLDVPDGATRETSAQVPNMGKEFDETELAWNNYRTAQCQTASDQYFGGTMRPSAFLGCRLNVTRRHMHELESLYGDLWY